MYDSPYSTTTFAKIQLATIISELSSNARLNNDIVVVSPGVGMLVDTNTKSPIWYLPITKVEHNRPDLPDVIIDARSFYKVPRGMTRMPAVIKNQSEYDFQLLRANLTRIWVNNPTTRTDFLIFSDFAPSIFVAWLSGMLSRKINYDAGQELMASMIIAYYYIALHFGPDAMLQPGAAAKITKLISRYTNRIPEDRILGMVSSNPAPRSLSELANLLKALIPSPRSDLISPGLIISSMSGSWFMGIAPNENVALSLEYPPNFIAMVSACLDIPSYRKVGLSQVIDRFNKQQAGQGFLRALKYMVNQKSK